MSGGGGVGIGADLDISLMDWSCEEKKESGAEGQKEGQYEQDDVGNKRGMECADGTEGANNYGSSLYRM